jgi:NAD+--asparagine ADP-ribosyltransferase
VTKNEREQREIAVYLEWIRANVPQLAFHNEDYQKQGITWAIGQTKGTRFWIAVAWGLLALLIGKKVLHETGFHSVSDWQESVVVSVPAAVVACLMNSIGHILVRRRIRELAGPVL